jgi:putative restriction endonuclease
MHRDNVGLRKVWEMRRPLILFYGVGNARYDVLAPVYIEGDDRAGRTFLARVDDIRLVALPERPEDQERLAARRRYLTVASKVRLHQRAFRERVLVAYGEQCALCRLRHRELLDGAHLLEDSEGGPPIIPNGMSLCKLHHAAFDNGVVGIHPDTLTVEVREDVLQEVDGPMLVHGLQELDGLTIHLPRRVVDRPNRQFLVPRYTAFRAA